MVRKIEIIILLLNDKTRRVDFRRKKRIFISIKFYIYNNIIKKNNYSGPGIKFNK